MAVLLIIAILGMLLVVHEAGHFLAARWVGMPVERFSIGFGPRLWSLRGGGTEFRIAAFPFGGYVLPAIPDEAAYFRIPVWRRVVFALGGPVANVVAAVPLFALLNLVQHGASVHGLVAAPFAQALDLLGRIAASFLVVFQRPDELAGVIGIVVEGKRFVGGDPAQALYFTTFLSLNLAIVNLFPIPALDGGKILLAVAEKLHPRARALHVPLTAFGWVVILGLVLYTLSLDLQRYLA